MNDLKLLATLCLSAEHFKEVFRDKRLQGVFLNTRKIVTDQLGERLDFAEKCAEGHVPVFFDVNGRQLRITGTYLDEEASLVISLSHAISVRTPVEVCLKFGGNKAILKRVTENGKMLHFDGCPQIMVEKGVPIYIDHPSLSAFGDQFTPEEKIRIEIAKKASVNNYVLSYVYKKRDIDELREMVGDEANIFLKIQNRRGLDFVSHSFKKTSNLFLIAARNNLVIELGDRPQDILNALNLIISKDPEALVASRVLTSVLQPQLNAKFIPSCADLCELAWLYDIGYRSIVLCSNVCSKEETLQAAANAFEVFCRSYISPRPVVSHPIPFLQRIFGKLTGSCE